MMVAAVITMVLAVIAEGSVALDFISEFQGIISLRRSWRYPTASLVAVAAVGLFLFPAKQQHFWRLYNCSN